MNALKTTVIEVLDRLFPEQIKNSMFHLSFNLAPEEFEKFAHAYGLAPNMRLGLAEMAARGLQPQTIVDVGAFEGSWSRLAKHVWPRCRLFMVEPNLQKRQKLVEATEELDGELFTEVLGSEDGRQVDFFVMESGSSIMEENSGVARTIEKRTLRRLDSLLSQVATPAFLKIDAQGYELEILKGASGILPAFDAVLLEVAIIEINKGAPLLHDVVAFMKTHGFVAYDILEIHRRPLDNALNQVDVVFVREQSHLISDKRHFA